ncbi:MAG: PilZ domain-containing protein [Planctomycetes bacterium]|nr:PilZ domain-containing protein [Planctomycetota bacterium]
MRALVPELSEPLDAAIRTALRPDPKDRPRSCLEFFKRLTARPRFDDGTGDDLPPSTVGLIPVVPAHERRAWVRHGLDAGAFAVIDTSVCGGGPDNEETWPLVVRDLSRGGVGVLIARRFEPGTELCVELSVGPDVAPRRLPARVVRVAPEKTGHWFHGCAFLNPLTGDELEVLLRLA